ncbi:hypothetical protein MHLNE_14300 [Moorella humiferrea]
MHLKSTVIVGLSKEGCICHSGVEKSKQACCFKLWYIQPVTTQTAPQVKAVVAGSPVPSVKKRRHRRQVTRLKKRPHISIIFLNLWNRKVERRLTRLLLSLPVPASLSFHNAPPTPFCKKIAHHCPEEATLTSQPPQPPGSPSCNLRSVLPLFCRKVISKCTGNKSIRRQAVKNPAVQAHNSYAPRQ